MCWWVFLDIKSTSIPMDKMECLAVSQLHVKLYMDATKTQRQKCNWTMASLFFFSFSIFNELSFFFRDMQLKSFMSNYLWMHQNSQAKIVLFPSQIFCPFWFLNTWKSIVLYNKLLIDASKTRRQNVIGTQ